MGLSRPFIYLQPTHGYAKLTPIDQGTTRALNISNFKKSAARTTSFGTTADPNIARTQNQVPGGGMLARSGSKDPTTRIYAPRPYTPSTALLQGPVTGYSGSEFKTPSLPFSKSIDEATVGQGSVETIAHQSASNSDASVSGLFRPMSSHPQDEMGTATHRPSSRPSFFGNAQFPFDNVTNNQDDSGYYSSVSEQNDNDGDQLSLPSSRSDAVRPAASGNEVQATRTRNMRPAHNPDFEPNFANPTKRTRPASPGDGEDVILPARSHELSKRPCVRRSPLHSRGSVSETPLIERVSPGPGGTQTFVLPPNVPHPSVTMGDFPGLDFSEADLGRYAELYEKGAERWSRATMEEWLSGANDIMAKFTEMVDMVSLSFRLCLGSLGGVPIYFLLSLRRSRNT